MFLSFLYFTVCCAAHRALEIKLNWSAAVLLSAVFSVVSVFVNAGSVSTDAEFETRPRAAAVVCGTGELNILFLCF